MGNKIKPWQKRKPKNRNHEEDRRKRQSPQLSDGRRSLPPGFDHTKFDWVTGAPWEQFEE